MPSVWSSLGRTSCSAARPQTLGCGAFELLTRLWLRSKSSLRAEGTTTYLLMLRLSDVASCSSGECLIVHSRSSRTNGHAPHPGACRLSSSSQRRHASHLLGALRPHWPSLARLRDLAAISSR